VRAAIAAAGDYRYEHIFIDNASADNTHIVLKEIAARDTNVKVIRNTRNFGHVRSPMHALYQTCGDAVIGIAADLQDPPEMIVEMIRKWENGYPVVIGVKAASDEHGVLFYIRKRYYALINRLSGVPTYENFTGFGLYDRKVVEIVKQFDDPYPYFRGMIAEIGFNHAELPYHQPSRKSGVTKNNLYSLYDVAILGVTNLSKVPLRIVTFSGFIGALLSVMVSLAYLVLKLLFWDQFSLGIAPLIIGLFFFMSLQMLFVGVVGEYIGAIHTLVQKRPLVIEEERINFEFGPGEATCKESSESTAGRQ
jgi:glycosyltransferase involved in cell wall biosynthesis